MLIRVLHIQDLSKSLNPSLIRNKGECFSYYINHIIVLKNILRHIRICPGAIKIYRPNSVVIICDI